MVTTVNLEIGKNFIGNFVHLIVYNVSKITTQSTLLIILIKCSTERNKNDWN